MIKRIGSDNQLLVRGRYDTTRQGTVLPSWFGFQEISSAVLDNGEDFGRPFPTVETSRDRSSQGRQMSDVCMQSDDLCFLGCKESAAAGILLKRSHYIRDYWSLETAFLIFEGKLKRGELLYNNNAPVHQSVMMAGIQKWQHLLFTPDLAPSLIPLSYDEEATHCCGLLSVGLRDFSFVQTRYLLATYLQEETMLKNTCLFYNWLRLP